VVQKKQNWAKSLTMAVNLATSVFAVIGIGLFGGKWLDAKFDTGNLLTIIGFGLGAATAGKMLWQHLMKQDQKESSPDWEKKDKDNNSN
jgi:F0F1-type ATP synthase assembly protein I